MNQNRTGVTLSCLPSGWVRIKLDPHPPSVGDFSLEHLPSVVLYRYDAVRPLSMCPHPVCSPADVQRLGSAGLQLLTSTQEEALPRTTSPELRSPHAGNRRTRDKSTSSRSPFHRQHSKDRAYFLGDGNGSPMSCGSRGIPIDGLSAGNLSDSDDDDSQGDWSPGSGSELDMQDTAKLLFNVGLQHGGMRDGGGGGQARDALGLSGSGMEESDEGGGHAKRRSRTYGVFDGGTRVIVTDPKFVQEHGSGCRGTIVFFKGGGWYFLRMDMDCGTGGANGSVVMFRPSSFHVIEGRGDVSAEDIALAEEKSGFTTVFPNGTRVSIVSPNTKGQLDDPTGKEGCVVDYKGGGWYFIKLDGVEAVTMSRKGSFVVLSLPPESDPVQAPQKSAAAESHSSSSSSSRRLKDPAQSRPPHAHSHRSKHSPPLHLDDKHSASFRPATFASAMGGGSAIAGGSTKSSSSKGGVGVDSDGRADDGDGALGALLSVAMGAEGSAMQTPPAKVTPKSATSHGSHVSPTAHTTTPQSMSASSHDVSVHLQLPLCMPLFATPGSTRHLTHPPPPHQVTSYASFEFRGTQSPAVSPRMKPMSHIRCHQ